jgi:hypothetical protein
MSDLVSTIDIRPQFCFIGDDDFNIIYANAVHVIREPE